MEARTLLNGVTKLPLGLRQGSLGGSHPLRQRLLFSHDSFGPLLNGRPVGCHCLGLLLQCRLLSFGPLLNGCPVGRHRLSAQAGARAQVVVLAIERGAQPAAEGGGGGRRQLKQRRLAAERQAAQ